MRSRHGGDLAGRDGEGITSACAEQTAVSSAMRTVAWDHLRVCGADYGWPKRHIKATGSPPRVRSRRALRALDGADVRITSACAEQTPLRARRTRSARDHLRVCGADRGLMGACWMSSGSPPRVRSRRTAVGHGPAARRITSACAEQTPSMVCVDVAAWDHLRVCGADSCILLCSEPAEWRGIFDLRTA